MSRIATARRVPHLIRKATSGTLHPSNPNLTNPKTARNLTTQAAKGENTLSAAVGLTGGAMLSSYMLKQYLGEHPSNAAVGTGSVRYESRFVDTLPIHASDQKFESPHKLEKAIKLMNAVADIFSLMLNTKDDSISEMLSRQKLENFKHFLGNALQQTNLEQSFYHVLTNFDELTGLVSNMNGINHIDVMDKAYQNSVLPDTYQKITSYINPSEPARTIPAPFSTKNPFFALQDYHIKVSQEKIKDSILFNLQNCNLPESAMIAGQTIGQQAYIDFGTFLNEVNTFLSKTLTAKPSERPGLKRDFQEKIKALNIKPESTEAKILTELDKILL